MTKMSTTQPERRKPLPASPEPLEEALASLRAACVAAMTSNRLADRDALKTEMDRLLQIHSEVQTRAMLHLAALDATGQ